MPNEFAAALKKSARTRAQFDGVIAVLNEFCAGVKTFAEQSKLDIDCYLQPGYSVNMGREYKMTIENARGLTHVLFRAYVPADGYPTTLNLYDDDLYECEKEMVLRQRLTAFIKKSGVRRDIEGFAV